MSGNLMLPDSVSINLKDFFEKMMIESFKQEREIYDKFSDLGIKSPANLHGPKCKELFKKMTGIDDAVFYMLRDRNFYYTIEKKFKNEITTINTNKLDNDLKREIEIITGGKAISLEDMDLKKVTAEIKKQVKNKSNNLNVDIIIEAFKNTPKAANKNNNALNNELKGIYRLLVNTENSTIKDEITKALTNMPAVFTNVKGERQWTSKDTKAAFLEIEKALDIEIFVKNEYFITEKPQNDELSELVKTFKSSMVTAISEYEKATSYYENNSMIKRDKSLETFRAALKGEQYDEIIKKGLEDQFGKSLIFDSKGRNRYKIRGDLGEFICGLILQNIGETYFAGDIHTSSGEAAIDIYANQIGYQIKNFAGRETNDIIPLYQSRLKIEDSGKDSRVFSKEEEENLFLNTNFYACNKEIGSSRKDLFKNEIFSILEINFPNFIRYSQKFYSDRDEELIEKGFDKIRNCFYILNFRIIPSSRIFYELMLQAKNMSSNNAGLSENYFYINKDEEKKIVSNENLINTLNAFKPWGPFYLYFKGIPINQKELRFNNTGGNLLSSVFPSNDYLI